MRKAPEQDDAVFFGDDTPTRAGSRGIVGDGAAGGVVVVERRVEERPVE